MKMQESASAVGINFTWEFDSTDNIHARHIVTDHGWKISLDRGLDIFQHYEMNDTFMFANHLQQFRSCKAFEVTFIRNEQASQASDNSGQRVNQRLEAYVYQVSYIDKKKRLSFSWIRSGWTTGATIPTVYPTCQTVTEIKKIMGSTPAEFFFSDPGAQDG